MMVWELLIGPISAGIGVLTTYALLKRTLRTESMLNKLDELLTEINKDPAIREQLAEFGFVLGYGVSKGLGVSLKGGKVNLKSIATSFLGAAAEKFLPKLLGGLGGGEEQQQQQQDSKVPW